MKRRSGLTLMELLVVLMILVALASLLIPLISNPMGRAHNSSGTVNMKEITKFIQAYQTQQYGFPDQWDAMTDGTTLASYLPKDDAGVPVHGDLTAGTLTADEVAALSSTGIKHVHLMYATAPSTAGFSPSFNPYLTPLPSIGTTITDTTNLALLSPAKAASQLNASLSGKYVAFGLGQRCTLVGKTIAEAPVTFSDEPAANPALTYVRFAVIFKVSEGGVALSKAQFVGTLHIATEGLHGVNAHLQEYYDIDK